jgi:hypothetical protein
LGLRSWEKEIANCALTEAIKYRKGGGHQGFEGPPPKSVEFEGRSVLQVEVEYHGSRFVALVDGTQLVALGYSAEDCYQYGCLSYVSKQNREEITELALKKLVACLASQLDTDAPTVRS